jgi:hypothetical protein
MEPRLKGRGIDNGTNFLWRPKKIAPLDSGTVWPDPADDFIREPFYASFRAGSFDFTLITIHVIFGDGIGDRREEALLLDDVYRTIQNSNPDEQDVILLGDWDRPMALSCTEFHRWETRIEPFFSLNQSQPQIDQIL